MSNIVFYEDGGHSGGGDVNPDKVGHLHQVSRERALELQEDKNPEDTLRCRWGRPEPREPEQ